MIWILPTNKMLNKETRHKAYQLFKNHPTKVPKEQHYPIMLNQDSGYPGRHSNYKRYNGVSGVLVMLTC